MTPIITPPYLKPGDSIGIIAPASVVQYQDLLPGIKILQDWGLNVVEGFTLKTSHNQFAATDQERLQDFQTMLDNESLSAIIAARGGYGCSRIVDELDFSSFIKKPKWIVGFSDLTVILSRTFLLGYQSVHGPMVKSMTLDGAENAADTLRKILFGEAVHYKIEGSEQNRNGTAQGQVVGGNLCLLAHMIGTGTDIDTKGKILFIEDVNEYLYNLDRMMIQLKRSGKLSHLAGLVIGQFTDVKDNAAPAFGKNIEEIIHEHVAEFSYPVCYNFPAGHVADNQPLVIGAEVSLEVSAEIVSLNFLPDVNHAVQI
ncbi:S66 peptidase family protein [Dyadobacter helix]|nr:LD-carboxypeptidase [Dyadobacter sp. CECT 9275]